MSSLTAHVGEGRNEVPRELALHAQTPLLRVRVLGFCGDRRYIDGKRSGNRRLSIARGVTGGAEITNARVAGWKWLRKVDYIRRACFERSGIRFVARTVLEEHAVTCPDRSFPVSLRIPCDTHSGCGVKDMGVDAARRNAIWSAFNDSIDDARIQITQVKGNRLGPRQTNKLSAERIHLDLRCQSLTEGLWLPVIGA